MYGVTGLIMLYLSPEFVSQSAVERLMWENSMKLHSYDSSEGFSMSVSQELITTHFLLSGTK